MTFDPLHVVLFSVFQQGGYNARLRGRSVCCEFAKGAGLHLGVVLHSLFLATRHAFNGYSHQHAHKSSSDSQCFIIGFGRAVMAEKQDDYRHDQGWAGGVITCGHHWELWTHNVGHGQETD